MSVLLKRTWISEKEGRPAQKHGSSLSDKTHSPGDAPASSTEKAPAAELIQKVQEKRTVAAGDSASSCS